MSHELSAVATVDRLEALRAAGLISTPAYHRALTLTLGPPPRADARIRLSRIALFLAAGLMLSGVVYFVAFNWYALPALAKLIALQVGVVVAGLVAMRGEGVRRQVGLLVAAVLLGPLLAVYGQTYQTGADAWELFAVWSLLALPFMLAARWVPLTFGFAALVDLTVELWREQATTMRFGEGALLHVALGCALWLAFEVLSGRLSGGAGRWAPRLIALLTMGVTTIEACLLIGGEHFFRDDLHPAHLVIAPVLAIALVAIYRRAKPDLFMLVLSAGTAIALVTTLAGRFLYDVLEHFQWGWLLLAAMLVAEVAIAVSALKKARFALLEEVAS